MRRKAPASDGLGAKGSLGLYPRGVGSLPATSTRHNGGGASIATREHDLGSTRSLPSVFRPLPHRRSCLERITSPQRHTSSRR